MKKLIFACLLLIGCAPQKHAYKVTFNDGSVDYYELDYKPKAGAKSIEYHEQTILGVESIEKID